MAFSRATPPEKMTEVTEFQQKIIRLFSLLHALILAELESESKPEGQSYKKANTFALIDIEGLDSESLKAIGRSHHKVDLVFTWIQCLLVEAVNLKILMLPPPILT